MFRRLTQIFPQRRKGAKEFSGFNFAPLRLCGKTSFGFVLLVALFMIFPAVASAVETPKKVLIFSGVDPNLPGVVLVNQILRSTLEQDWPGRIQFYSEALDHSRIPEEKYEQEMVRLLQRKYEAENIDLIFTLGSAALRFLLKHQEEIFSDTPKIFVNTTDHEVDGLELGQYVTGVQGRGCWRTHDQL